MTNFAEVRYSIKLCASKCRKIRQNNMGKLCWLFSFSEDFKFLFQGHPNLWYCSCSSTWLVSLTIVSTFLLSIADIKEFHLPYAEHLPVLAAFCITQRKCFTCRNCNLATTPFCTWAKNKGLAGFVSLLYPACTAPEPPTHPFTPSPCMAGFVDPAISILRERGLDFLPHPSSPLDRKWGILTCPLAEGCGGGGGGEGGGGRDVCHD
jgi:hypothetical protein